MSFFEDASLVLIPSGIKDQKIYSVKPTDGTGDLTFTRASNATRVASNGLIEKVRTNIVPFSEQFDNAAWVKQNITVSPNTQTAPDGTLSADKVIVANGAAFSSTSNYCRTAALTLTTGVVYTVSVYAKADGFDVLLARISTSSAMGSAPTLNLAINLTTGVAISTSFGTYIGREAAANGYYRYIFQTNAIASATNYLSFVPSDTTATEGNGVDGISIWGAMAEIGDIATDYIATTTTAVSVGPVSGLPRLDYLNSSCPRLLLEPQRTNLVRFSENFDNAAYQILNCTITANNTTAPDGTAGADKLSASVATTSNPAEIFQATVQAANTAHSFSVYAKKSTSNFIALRLTSVAGNPYAWFNLNTGNVGTVQSGITASIVSLGNGWYRCTVTGTTQAVIAVNRVDMAVSDNNGNFVCAINGSVFIWGAQLEAGAYATSYIPTLSTSVTRVADAAFKSGISSLIGQTEGTLFLEITTTDDITTVTPIGISNGTGSNRVLLFVGAGTLTALVTVSGVAQASISSSAISANTSYKMAIAYKANDFAFYVNGALVGTDTSGTVPACSKFNYDNGSGSAPFYGLNNQALLFKTRLTNAQLSELTTL
jgi:hypothetical protein